MVDAWNQICLRCGDMAFGWAMRISPEVALLALSLGSAALLLLARRILADQDLLRRAAADRRVLRARIDEAKRQADREQVERLQSVRSRVALKRLRQEAGPLIVVLPGLALLATWGMQRLTYQQPAANRPVAVSLITPASRAGELSHLVPGDGMTSNEGWVRRVQAVQGGSASHGSAHWRIHRKDAEEAMPIVFRLGTETVVHAGEGGPIQEHGDGLMTRVQLDLWRPFGLVPGAAWLGIAPWLVGYIILVVPLFYLGKALFRIW